MDDAVAGEVELVHVNERRYLFRIEGSFNHFINLLPLMKSCGESSITNYGGKSTVNGLVFRHDEIVFCRVRSASEFIDRRDEHVGAEFIPRQEWCHVFERCGDHAAIGKTF